MGVPAERRDAHTTQVPRVDRSRERLRTITGCLVLLLAAASACTSQEGTSPRATDGPSISSAAVPSADARARLIELGDTWLRTPATVTYRTVGAVDGQPTSTHQCLRQLVDTREDIVPSLRRCSRQGELELAWDPPQRWRVEVTSPVDRFTVISTRARTRICRSGADRCRTISTALAGAEAGIDILFRLPEQVLHVIGADEVHVSDRGAPEGIGSPVECFRASGPNGHAEWCYTGDGVLVSLLEGAGVSDWTILEATTVTPGVDPTEFEPTTI